MRDLFRRIIPATACMVAASCGATSTPPETQPEAREATPAEPPEQLAEASETDAGPAGTKTDTVDQEASAQTDTKAEAEWSPETAQEIVERARRKLTRRCQAGSQAACSAIPNLDKCVALRRAACAKLGELFARGATGVDRNPAHARDFWWRACDIASADCVRYGKLLFDMEDLDARQAVTDRFFQMGCTSDFKLCESAGRFYQEKNELAAARKFFDLGCSAGQATACQAKKAGAAQAASPRAEKRD